MDLGRIMAAALTAVTVATTAMAGNEWLSTTHDFGAFDENLGKVYCDWAILCMVQRVSCPGLGLGASMRVFQPLAPLCCSMMPKFRDTARTSHYRG